MAVVAGALMWLWLMHTRTLPLQGCMCPVHLMLSLWYYGLVAVPMWCMVHGQHSYKKTHDAVLLLTSSEVVLALWTLGFVAAVISVNDEYTPMVMFAAAGTLLFMVLTPTAWVWMPYYELAFGLYAWETLLH